MLHSICYLRYYIRMTQRTIHPPQGGGTASGTGIRPYGRGGSRHPVASVARADRRIRRTLWPGSDGRSDECRRRRRHPPLGPPRRGEGPAWCAPCCRPCAAPPTSAAPPPTRAGGDGNSGRRFRFAALEPGSLEFGATPTSLRHADRLRPRTPRPRLRWRNRAVPRLWAVCTGTTRPRIPITTADRRSPGAWSGAERFVQSPHATRQQGPLGRSGAGGPGIRQRQSQGDPG